LNSHTGTVVRWKGLGSGEGVNPERERSARLLIDTLAGFLPPYVAQKVRIVTEDGKQHELTKRALRGQPLTGAKRSVPHLGDVTWEIAVVAKTEETGYDRLEIGAMGPLCALMDVLERLLRDKRYRMLETKIRSIWRVLCHVQVIGLVDVSKLNEYRNNSSLGFNENLYDDEEVVLALLDFLEREIVPPTRKLIGRSVEEVVTSDDDSLVTDIVGLFHKGTGLIPEARPPRVEGNDHPTARVEIEPGQQYVFEVPDGAKEGVRYVWDSSECGGTVIFPSADKFVRSLTYQAGQKLDTFRLVVREFGDASKPPVAAWTIRILQEVPMRFTQPVIHTDTGRIHTLRLSNLNRLQGTLKWDVEGSGGTVEITPDLLQAKYTAGEEEGTWSIRVVDSKNPSRFAAVTIHIEEGKGARTTTRATSTEIFTYKERDYRVALRPSDSDAYWKYMSYMNEGELTSVISINTGHPALKGQPDAARMALVRREVCLQVVRHDAEQTGADIDFKEMLERANTLLGQLISGKVIA